MPYTIRNGHTKMALSAIIDAVLKLDPQSRETTLSDPNKFAALVAQDHTQFANGLRNIIKHIVRPDAFEPIMSDDHRKRIVASLGTPAEAGAADLDERLRLIRARLTPELGDGFSFYSPALRPRWEKSEIHYWKIAPGDQAKDWDLCREAGFIYMNGDSFGDLTTLTREQFEARCDQVATAEGKQSNVRESNSFANLVWRFAKDVKEGDIIFANRGFKEVLGIGRVAGDYHYEAEDHVGPHRRKINWYDLTPRVVNQPGWRSTLAPVKRKDAEAILEGDAAGVTSDRSATEVLCEYLVLHPGATLAEVRAHADANGVSIAELTLKNGLYHYGRAMIQAFAKLKPVSRGAADVKQIFDGSEPPHLELLLARKNAVLYGPPGTGKTHAAERIIEWWKQKHGADCVRFATFHPSFAYEDFIEGFRPDEEGRFSLQEGIFKAIADAARADRSRDYLLVIDELNRGDVARVFGELITLIEPTKRDRIEAHLAYSKRPFSVPANLYLLGTMNTADRSISLLDVAIRRRFAFVEVGPSADVFGTSGFVAAVSGVSLARLLTGLNELLQEVGVEADRAVGHSYLLIRDDDGDPLGELRRRVLFDLIPLIEEYCYAHRPDIAKVLSGLVTVAGAADLDAINDDAGFIGALTAISKWHPAAVASADTILGTNGQDDVLESDA